MRIGYCLPVARRLLDSVRNLGLGLLAGLLVASGALAQEAVTFQERYRPQFHYTAVKGWINDPIGLLYYDGEYHLFNDHNVKSTRFPGGKFDGEQSHWSHAVSKDLVHWEHMPVAVYPDRLGACWSGAGVVDWKNTTGFQTGKEPPLVLAYTSAGSWGQSLIYSNDRGRTWTKHEGNPVLDKIADSNRDPQVFWHEPTKKWVMVLYVQRGQAHFFKSEDMKTWTATSVVPLEGFHECPDMFTLPVDGDQNNRKWVIYDGPFHYWIGEFDGETFRPQTPALRCEFGNNFHAAQSWETPDGRRVQIGWMNGGAYPGMPFNQQMTFPSELTLRTTADGVRLFMYPIDAIRALHTESFSLENHVLKPGDNPLADISGELFDIEMVIEPGEATEFGIRLHETAVIYSDNQITSAGAKAEVSPIDGVLTLRILVDRTSIETFVNRGQVALPCCYLPKNLTTGLDLYAKGGDVKIRSLRVTKLKSCWESRDTHGQKADIPSDSAAGSNAAAEDPLAAFYEQPPRFQPRPPADGRSAAWFLERKKSENLDAGVYHGEREQRAKVSGELPYRYRDAASRPELPFEKIIFVKRFTYHSSHFYTDFLDGCSLYGGNISILDLSTGKVQDLFPEDSEMAGGIFGRFTLSSDATKIVFDWKKAPIEGFRIFEVNVDGTGLRQLTFPPSDEKQRIARYTLHTRGGNQSRYFHQTDDMHPCYAPDGSIFFTSTRPQHGVLCSTYLTAPVIHKMNADGSNIRQLTNSAVSEFSPAVLPDGWITYSRWEYVDKGQLGIKCLWAMKPDGSGSREIYGNDIPFPPTMLHGRPIPDKSHKLVMLGTPHYPQSGIGTVISVDTTKDIRTRDPMHFVTWWVDIRQEPGWNHFLGPGWARHGNGPLYMDPHPLAEDLFLVSHNRDRAWNDPTAYELMLLDDSGNHWPILASDEISLWQPTPLVPRKRPPVMPSTLDPELAKKGLAVCYVQDIHHGMEGIKPGEVKYIRIIEQLPRPWSCRRLWEPKQNLVNLISPRSALAGKVLRGVVPVEEDGSAHFYVPAGRNIYFEALDAKYRELQRERTYVNYIPGERRGCVGCHESPNDAPFDRLGSAMAFKKPPVHPLPQPGDETAARPIHFAADVQPVLDRHCVKCHGGERKMAGLDLRGELTQAFSKSYERLLRYVKTTDEGSDFGGSEYLPPKSVGSHASRLIQQLDKGCTGMEYKLPLEDYVKITTWVDANAVYYGSYWGRIRIEHRDHPNFRPVPTLEDALSTEPSVPWTQR